MELKYLPVKGSNIVVGNRNHMFGQSIKISAQILVGGREEAGEGEELVRIPKVIMELNFKIKRRHFERAMISLRKGSFEMKIPTRFIV